MIELRDIAKSYKLGKKKQVEALKGITITLPDKGMVFIVGKSGGGKSTILNILGGLDAYDSGSFLINGVSTKSFTQENWDSYRNNYVGFVFQDHYLMNDYNVNANIEFALALQSKNVAITPRVPNDCITKTENECLTIKEHANQAISETSNQIKPKGANQIKIDEALQMVGLEGYKVKFETKLGSLGKPETTKTDIPFETDDLTDMQQRFSKQKFYACYSGNIYLSNLGESVSPKETEYYNDTLLGYCEIDKQGLQNFEYTLLGGEYPNDSWAESDIMISKYV